MNGSTASDEARGASDDELLAVISATRPRGAGEQCENWRTVPIRMPASMHRRLKDLAHSTRRSLNETGVLAIARWLQRAASEQQRTTDDGPPTRPEPTP